MNWSKLPPLPRIADGRCLSLIIRPVCRKSLHFFGGAGPRPAAASQAALIRRGHPANDRGPPRYDSLPEALMSGFRDRNRVWAYLDQHGEILPVLVEPYSHIQDQFGNGT